MRPESKIMLSVVAALAASAVIGFIAFDVLRELQAEFERIERLTE
jgi:type II secretory pathway component PulJ